MYNRTVLIIETTEFHGTYRYTYYVCLMSNAVQERPVDKSQNFDGVAYIA